jgi:hypothetical protein
MDPTDKGKWAVLRELALARFPEDVEVAEAMRRAEELTGQQSGDTAAFWQRWRRWCKPRRTRGSARPSRS